MELFGKTMEDFQVPVCSLFTEKIVSGQVCYEADINQFKTNELVDWATSLKRGLSFIVDTNEEYQMKTIIKQTQPVIDDKQRSFNAYKDFEDSRSFLILLKTISR